MKNKSRLGTALVVLAGLTGTLAAAGPASAMCPKDDPDCGTGGSTTVTRTLTVARPSAGTITGGGIDCGTTCSKTFTFDPDIGGPAVALNVSGGAAGFSPSWSGCDTASGSTCDVDMSDSHSVSVAWVDVAAPTIGGLSMPAKTSGNLLAQVAASDNAAVSRVDFALDGVSIGSDTTSPWAVMVTTSSLAEGTHTLSARAYDTSGNGSSLASGTFVVDRSTSVSLGASPVANAVVGSAPSLSFTAPADVAQRNCSVHLAGASGTFQACASPFAPALAADGDYVYDVRVTDDVGNTATASRAFTLDRTAPALSFTDGPAEGATVATASITIGFATSDAHAKSVTCQVDGGAAGPCTTADSHAVSGLTDGTHTVKVVATDAAGNATTRVRTFSVALPKPQDGGGSGGSGGGSNTGGTGSAGAGGGAGSTGGSGVTGGGSAGGGGTAGTGASGSSQAGASPAPVLSGPAGVGATGTTALGTFHAVPTVKSRRSKGRTTLTKVALAGLPAGTTLKVTCTGKGRPFGAKSVTVKRGKADLSKLFAKKALKAGITVRLQIAAPGYRAATITIAIRKGKAPKVTTA